MNLYRLFITTSIVFILFINHISHSYADDTVSRPDAGQLDQTGRDYFAKGDYKQAIHYLELSLVEYERLGKKTDIAKTLQNLGLAFLMSANFEQADLYLHQAENLLIKLDNKSSLAYCWNNLGLVGYYKGNYPSALNYYKKASEIYRDIDSPEDYAELTNRIGMTYWSLGINDKALEYMHRYISLLNPENPKSRAIGFNNLGAVYRDIGDDEKALEYYRKAAGLYMVEGDSIDLPSPLTNIGTIYGSRLENDSALFYYNKSLIISDKLNDRLQSAKTKHNIALIYKVQGKYQEAENLLKEYLTLSLESGYKEGIAQAELSLGNLARDMKNPGKAQSYYHDCIRDAGRIKSLNALMQAHKNLADILVESRHYEEALSHFLEYNNIKDTLLNKEKARIITELETRYETEKKEQENILLTKDNELKDKTINTLYITLAGIMIITVSVIFLIILYRRNALNKRRLAESEAARLTEKIEFQNRELASGALALSRNLSFIRNLLTELKELSPYVDTKGLSIVQSISRNIQHLDKDPAWDEFEMRFNQVHISFYDNLVRKYPSLTNNELRLCALLKLGMNTKEIASITYQNIRAIETARLRLRKKLGIDSSEELGTFLQKI